MTNSAGHRTRRRPLLAAGLGLFLATAIVAAPPSDRPLWLRYPAVSPDGATIAFTSGGQLWRVPAAGGEAVPLTSGEFYSTRPVWSPDGTKLAFACKRHGNLDVFIMPAEGGEITRLTYDSADDRPYAFSPDGQSVYFASARLGTPQTIHAGTYAGADQLYTVPAVGGRSRLVIPTPALEVSVDPAGRQLLYENRPIYENEWRKGSVSDGAHDLWLYDLAQKTHRQLTDFRGEDRDPIWAPDGHAYYYLSERSGSFNVWRSDLQPDAKPVAITDHHGAPVRFVSVAADGSLVYGLDGEIWRRAPGAAASQRVPVRIRQSSLVQNGFSTNVNEYLSDLVPSPDGRQLALIARGEIFVLSTETGRTRRITNTPGHENFVSFAPDGRSLVYVAERDGDMDIYESALGEPGMTSFDSPGPIVERKLIDTQGDVLFPKISPDGKRLAFLADRSAIKVFDRATGETTTVLPAGSIYSYQDGDLSFEWSPDSRWLTATTGSIVTNQDIAVLDASGKTPPVFVTKNAYADAEPHFSPDGQAVVWASGREGLRQADTNTGQLDLFMAYLTREAFDAARTPALAGPAPAQTAAAANEPATALPPQAAGIEHRTRRLTPFSITPLLYAITPDNKSLVYIDAEATGRAVVYKLDLRTGIPAQLFAKPIGAFAVDPAVQNLYSLHPAGIERTSLATGAAQVFPLQTPLDLDPRGELAYWFNHFWRLTKLKFHEPTMHRVDWDAVRTRYVRFLPSIDTWEDFAEMMSEMAGELNASHMGCFYLKPPPLADATASLGLYFDESFAGPGERIAAILPGGPADRTASPLAPGAVVLALNGTALDAHTTLDRLLNRMADTPVQLTVRPADGSAAVAHVVVPIRYPQAVALAYEQWISERKALTEKLSHGRIGYIHLPAMNPEAFKRAYGEVIGDYRDKDALIIDVRYNGGGNLHDQLITLFTGEVVAAFTNRDGAVVGRMPTGRWSKPTALLQNAAAYSDGSIFPHLYKRQKLGPIVGERVPGTGTAVWWMEVMNHSLKWGIPQLGAKDFTTGWFENQEIVPDILLHTDPAAVAAGRDPQLEAAVAELLKTQAGK